MKVFRGIVESATGLAGALARLVVKGRSGEKLYNRPMMQQYGLASRPKAGAPCLVLHEGENFYIIASENVAARIALEEGEVALHTDANSSVHLKQDGSIYIKGAKIFIGNEQVELIEWLISLTDAIMNSFVPTISGPQKLSEVLLVGSPTFIPLLKQKLELLKSQSS
jgi:phage gp45-like